MKERISPWGTLKLLVFYKSGLLCMGGCRRKDFNFESVQKDQVVFGHYYYLWNCRRMSCPSPHSVGKLWGYGFCSLFLASLGSSFFSKSVANGLTWEFCEQGQKKGLENSSSKGCKTQFNLLRIPLFVTFITGLANFFKMFFILARPHWVIVLYVVGILLWLLDVCLFTFWPLCILTMY